MEGGRERGREREREREGKRDGGRERGREREREGKRERDGGRERERGGKREREGGKERERVSEGGIQQLCSYSLFTLFELPSPHSGGAGQNSESDGRSEAGGGPEGCRNQKPAAELERRRNHIGEWLGLSVHWVLLEL